MSWKIDYLGYRYKRYDFISIILSFIAGFTLVSMHYFDINLEHDIFRPEKIEIFNLNSLLTLFSLIFILYIILFLGIKLKTLLEILILKNNEPL